MNALSADQLIDKIRAEAARSGIDDVSTARRKPQVIAGLISLGGKPVPANFAQRREYQIQELIDFPDRLFVRAAYLAVLGREPDSNGLQHHADSLRRAEMTKPQLLRLLRASDEGAQKGAVIHGLDADVIAEARERKRFVGPLFRILGMIKHLPRIRREQRRMNAGLEEMLVNNREAGRALNADFVAMKSMLEADLAIVMTQTTRLLQDIASLQRQQHEVRTARDDVARHADTTRALGDRLDTLTTQFAGFGAAIHAVRATAVRQQDEILALSRSPAPIAGTAEAVPASSFDALFAAWRDRRAPSLSRLRLALPHLTRAVVDTGCDDILDLQCGRGAWLQLVQQSGYRGFGLDDNGVMAADAAAQGLAVQHANMPSGLQALESGRFAFVSARQVIDRLMPEALITLLDEIHRVLCPGGMVLLETPNGRNPDMTSDDAARDLIPCRPVHPDTLSWLGAARGFTEGAVFYLDHDAMVPAARFECHALQNRQKISADYVWIARKAGAAG